MKTSTQEEVPRIVSANLKLRECLNKVMDNAEILVATPVPEVPQGTAIPSAEPYEESEAEMADGEGAISQ